MKSHLLNLVVVICALLGSVCFADDDPNYFNETTGLSSISSGTATADDTCGWMIAAVRDGTFEEGSDGGQLTIELNTCKIFDFEIERFPQSGGAGGTADLVPDDVIIVWDEDASHGDDETQKNFTFTGTYEKLAVSEYEDYLRLTTTIQQTNWAVYEITSVGTFTKENAGTNEHEILHLARNIMTFWKQDDVSDANCVSPGDTFEYSICWINDSGQAVSEGYIIDWLPDGVDYDYIISLDPLVLDENYNIEEHYYRWELDDIDPNEWGCVHLEVTVNHDAETGYYLYNLAEMYLGDNVVASDDEYTDVCCWSNEPNVIYVDKSAIHGANTGLNWSDAYLDLADALERAANSLCGGPFTIYAAQGVYDPNKTPGWSFVLPDGVSVYGGFKSGGCAFSERKPKKYKTILTGLIDDDEFPDADTVVTMGDETLLDGFTISDAFDNAVYGNGVDFSVANCIITENYGYGIYAEDGDVSVQWCNISLNDSDGIRHEGAGFALSVDNSWLLRNGEHGIQCRESTLTAKNSIVSESDLKELSLAGIRLYRPTYSPVLQNLTIANNKTEGISFSDNGDIRGDPNKPDLPDIQNCIVYYNNNGKNQLNGFDADNIANFCCIQDCNELYTTNYNDFPGFAYKVDPNNIPDPNNYHLAHDAFCIDKANPYLSYTAQVDIDAEGVDRKYGDYVDIGADEVYSCDEPLTEDDVFNELDWDADGLVNFEEYSAFARAWLSHDPNEPGLTDPNDWYGWNSACNLVTSGSSEYVIDLYDLTEFIGNGYWLWMACWKANEILEPPMIPVGGEGMQMLPMETFSTESVYADPIEEDPYAAMSNSDLASMIRGIFAVLDAADTALAENDENIENWLEIKDFLESVLEDIKASRQ